MVSERAITYSCMLRKRQTKENSLQRYDLLICSLYRKIHNVQWFCNKKKVRDHWENILIDPIHCSSCLFNTFTESRILHLHSTHNTYETWILSRTINQLAFIGFLVMFLMFQINSPSRFKSISREKEHRDKHMFYTNVGLHVERMPDDSCPDNVEDIYI